MKSSLPWAPGGMGEVYRARNTRLDRTVAVKVLPTHLSDNPEFKQRFERESVHHFYHTLSFKLPFGINVTRHLRSHCLSAPHGCVSDIFYSAWWRWVVECWLRFRAHKAWRKRVNVGFERAPDAIHFCGSA